MTPDLDQLALSLKMGDIESLKELIDLLTRRLIAVAYRYTADWEMARDLTQDTWLKVLQSIHRYDPSRPFEQWLATIHRNGCISYLRRSSRRMEQPEPADVIERAADTVADGPGRDLESREFAARLAGAVRRLSRRQQEVFSLVDLDEVPQAEAARTLHMKPTTLRSTLHAARRRLASRLSHGEV
ncbi:MAG: RNA polymerase sigma factor [Candidatus Eisenbacteria bacterium]|nr:RNA polymerase sigma factor [Candidatus Eisenbacteria bacterium]